MIRPIYLIGLLAVSLLAGCAKTPTPAAPVAGSPSTQEEDMTNMNLPEPAPALKSEDAAKQAGMLAAHIDTRPECAQYREPLEAASKAAPGTPAMNVDMTELMRQAQAANCTRK